MFREVICRIVKGFTAAVRYLYAEAVNRAF